MTLTTLQGPARQEKAATPDSAVLQWMDQLAQEMLLTAQALQQLHQAFDKKFTGGPPDL